MYIRKGLLTLSWEKKSKRISNGLKGVKGERRQVESGMAGGIATLNYILQYFRNVTIFHYNTIYFYRIYIQLFWTAFSWIYLFNNQLCTNNARKKRKYSLSIAKYWINRIAQTQTRFLKHNSNTFKSLYHYENNHNVSSLPKKKKEKKKESNDNTKNKH